MSRTLLATDTTPTSMFRLGANGELTKVEPNRDDYVTPPRGTRARIELSGISETFLMDSQFSPGEQVEKVRLEWRIVKGQGNAAKMYQGKCFSELYTWKIGPKSNLGKLIGALRGTPVKPGESIDPDTYIGTTLVTTTTLNDAGTYAGVSVEAIEAGSVQLPAGIASDNGTEPGAGDEEDDPYDDDL